ncbi:hypothetical protein [Lentzea albidocapillata]|uniref:Uncharacterized protein n=1 Tax=Lentzea albidocapillata TaxID=40571 RepID=A0A1W2DHP4_9PSEU|nr:hypothetical protein [Lentzea albidocapillata]SMC96488.1 hypothetical protein SAMN05660733_03003 [Lentzea albidocapillata]
MSTEPQQSTGVAVAGAAASAPPVAPVATPDAESASSATTQTRIAVVPAVVEASAAVSTSKAAKVSKPMIVAAAVAGVVLIALPVAFGTVLNNGDQPGEHPNNAGYAQVPAPGDGFVPGVADPRAENTDTTTAQPNGSAPAQTADGRPVEPGEPANPGNAAAPGTPGQAPVQNQAPNPQGNPAPAQIVTYEATAGPGCTGSTRFTGVGSYRDGQSGWVDHGNGGCGTSFVSIPMSGDATKDDTSAYGLWTFDTGSVKTGSCTVSVFVPNGDITKVGGNPTHYRVYDRFDVAKGSPTGSFQVSQVANRGKWVSAGSFKVTGSKLAVQLLTRGEDWKGSTRNYAHHAAAMVKATCQA